MRRFVIVWLVVLCTGVTVFSQSPAQNYKAQVVKDVDGMAKEQRQENERGSAAAQCVKACLSESSQKESSRLRLEKQA